MTTKQRDRKCSSCRHYQPSPLWRKGWCRNPLLFDPTTNHLVESESLSCARAFIDYWEPRSVGDKSPVGPSVPDRPRVAPSIPLIPTGPGGAPLRTPPATRTATAEALSPAREKPPLTLVRAPAPPGVTAPLESPVVAEAETATDAAPAGATIRIEGIPEIPKPPEATRISPARTRGILLGLIVLSLAVLMLVPQIRSRLGTIMPTPVLPTATTAPLPVVIAPPPTQTPVPPTPIPPPPPPAPVLAVEGFAQVVNTDGAGLRIRDNPSTKGKVLVKAPDGARLQIKEGPRNDGKRNWWRVTGFDTKGTLGWASEEYLKAVP